MEETIIRIQIGVAKGTGMAKPIRSITLRDPDSNPENSINDMCALIKDAIDETNTDLKLSYINDKYTMEERGKNFKKALADAEKNAPQYKRL